MNYNLKYGKGTLSEHATKKIVDFARNKMNCKPSFLITMLYHEGNWGGSDVAIQNNNLGGMTWNERWTNPQKRRSGVTVRKGSPRPKNEGGNYIKYDSVDDFYIDWFHLISRGNGYNAADKSTFEDSVKGLFLVGGATIGNYATAGYQAYLKAMVALRKSINNANNNMLDKLDNNEDGGTITLPNESDFENNFVTNIFKLIDDLRNVINLGFDEAVKIVENMFKPKIYRYGNSTQWGNKFISVKEFNQKNLITINTTKIIKNLFEEIARKTNNNVGTIIQNIDIIKQPRDTQIPEPSLESTPGHNGKRQPQWPTTPGAPITSPYGPRIAPAPGASTFHFGIDIGAKHGSEIYLTQRGKCIKNRWTNWGGWQVYFQHLDDPYFSLYQHMSHKSNIAVGAEVARATVIGHVGNTGIGSGAHLHFEIAKSAEGFHKKEGTIDAKKYLNMFF